MDDEITKIKRRLSHTEIAVSVLSCVLLIVALKLAYLETNFNEVVASLGELVEHLSEFVNSGM